MPTKSKTEPEVKKVVLAYSGGLDTSIIVPWLKNNYGGCEVICFTADLGQNEDLSGLKKKAIASGASKLIEYAASGKHHDVKVDPVSLARIVAVASPRLRSRRTHGRQLVLHPERVSSVATVPGRSGRRRARTRRRAAVAGAVARRRARQQRARRSADGRRDADAAHRLGRGGHRVERVDVGDRLRGHLADGEAPVEAEGEALGHRAVGRRVQVRPGGRARAVAQEGMVEEAVAGVLLAGEFPLGVLDRAPDGSRGARRACSGRLRRGDRCPPAPE